MGAINLQDLHYRHRAYTSWGAYGDHCCSRIEHKMSWGQIPSFGVSPVCEAVSRGTCACSCCTARLQKASADPCEHVTCVCMLYLSMSPAQPVTRKLDLPGNPALQGNQSWPTSYLQSS